MRPGNGVEAAGDRPASGLSFGRAGRLPELVDVTGVQRDVGAGEVTGVVAGALGEEGREGDLVEPVAGKRVLGRAADENESGKNRGRPGVWGLSETTVCGRPATRLVVDGVSRGWGAPDLATESIPRNCRPQVGYDRVAWWGRFGQLI